MAFPICDECASSGILCSKCERRVRRGEVSELDVLVSTILAGHKATGYESIIDLENKLVILASDEEVPKIIGRGGTMAAELAKKLGRRVVVLNRGADREFIIKSLARPNKVVAMNKVFKPGDEEVLKLIFDKPLDEGTVQVLKDLIGEVEIEYERPLEKVDQKKRK